MEETMDTRRLWPHTALLLILLITNTSYGKVLLFTYAFNQPDFIVLQHKTFKKFLKDKYEFIVFNDAVEKQKYQEIKKTCKQLGIRCVRIPQEIHNRPYLNRPIGREWHVCDYQCPSVRNSNVVQYSLDTVGFDHDDIIVLFESDLFPIKKFSFQAFLQGYDVAGFDRSVEDPRLAQKNVPFLWVGLLLLNLNTMPHPTAFNLNCGYVNNIVIDAGGYSNYYLRHNPDLGTRYIDKIYSELFICQECEQRKAYRCTHSTKKLKQAGFDTRTIQLIQDVPIDWGSGVSASNIKRRRNIEFFMDNTFVHFYGGTGYAKYSYLGDKVEQFYADKTKAFFDYIHDITR